MVANLSFFNGCFDKGRLKALISWSVINCGEQFTIELVENLKNVGFEYATQAGVSLSLDDLKIPPSKAHLVSEAELQISSAQIEYNKGHLTAVEKFQQLIDTWHRTSETLKQNVIQYFRATDVLNPVYMMAFSGARGNVSQVRQLVGMRGLMADPQGQIIDFPIRSNFREGLTLTEYVISCYGARKGLVDTALRTANSGYLTRRLVDVSQHVIVCKFDCGTQRGILLSDMTDGQKVLISLQNRLLGRVLAENISTTSSHNTNSINKTSSGMQNIPSQNIVQTQILARKNQEISANLAEKIANFRIQVLVRSPLTCEAKNSICQLCYGWSLAHGNLVSLGEAVGILAAQSIGEPGTQLTMRTFHTGGVFSGDLMTEIRAPFNGVVEFTESLQGVLIRTPHGRIAFFTKIHGEFYITSTTKTRRSHSPKFQQGQNNDLSRLYTSKKVELFKIPTATILFVRQGEFVQEKQLIAEFSSISTQPNQRIQEKRNLNSELEGQVFFENVVLGIAENKNKEITRIAKKLGSIWILSGKIYQTMVPTSFFPQPGDVIDTKSVLNQILVVSPYTGFLTTHSKKILFSVINHKLIANKSDKYFASFFQNSGLLAKYSISQLNKSDIGKFTLRPTLKLPVFPVGQLVAKSENEVPKKSFSLSCTLLSVSLKSVSYYKLGYFLTFWNKKQRDLSGTPRVTKELTSYLRSDLSSSTDFITHRIHQGVSSRSQLDFKDNWAFQQNWQKTEVYNVNSDPFFLSTSLEEQITKSAFSRAKGLTLKKRGSQGGNAQKLVYLQSFPKNYKTQTGGLLIYDSLYFNDNGGQIFWIPEEKYQLDPKTSFIPTSTGFTFFPALRNRTTFIQKFSKKWITNNSPLLSKYNSQGQINNFSAHKSGLLQIKLLKNSKKFNVPSQMLVWNTDQLKTLFCQQVVESRKLVSRQVISFRQNPYVLITKRYIKTKTIRFSQSEKSVFSKNRLCLVSNLTATDKCDFYKKIWFLDIKKYKWNPAFLNTEKSASMTIKAPFLNPLFVFNRKNIINSPTHDSNKIFSEGLSQVKVIERLLKKSNHLQKSGMLNATGTTSSFEIGIKSGWVYFPDNQSYFSPYHKSILQPGFSFIDSIQFDQHTIYTEYISIPFLSLQTCRFYFNPLQVKEKTISLKVQLNFQKLINSFSRLFLKTNTRFYPVSKTKPQPFCSNQNKKNRVNSSKKYNNLNVFLVKLEKFLFLKNRILKNNPSPLFTICFTLEEKSLIRDGIPIYIKLGLDITLISDKIYYIKNQNNRYCDFYRNKNGNKKASFYLSRSYLELKNLNSIKRHSRTQISSLKRNLFTFQNCWSTQIKTFSSPGSVTKDKFKNINSQLITPSFCLLIRKVKQYSRFNSKHYNKIFLQTNQRDVSVNYLAKSINFPWFNKQNQTKLFSTVPSVGLQINSSLRFQNSKQKFVTQKLNIFEFFILLHIPKRFPFNQIEVTLISKQILLPMSYYNPIGLKLKDQLHLSDTIYNHRQHQKQLRVYLDLVSKSNGTITMTSNRLEFRVSRKINNSSFVVPALKNIHKTTEFRTTNVILHKENYIFANNPLSLTNFFSPYAGEIIDIKVDSLGKKSCFFLTEQDQLSFSTEKKIPFTFVGNLIRYGEQIAENLALPNSGQILQVDKVKVVLRKAQPILFSSKGVFYVYHGDFVQKNSPLLTFFYQRLKTGDIVQGIPQIEKLFEARQTQEGEILPDNIHAKLHDFFETYQQQYSPQDAARKSVEKIQQVLVDEVQRVYQSQGVTIADKHLEIIVRQMTSKVKIIEGGKSGLLRGELITLDWIESVNKSITSQKAEYEPVILGITKAALETESFISAASFQETTRILAGAAIQRKTDFLRGLKENVILGHLIPAGTGFSRAFNPEALSSATEIEKRKILRKIYLGLTKK